MWGRVQPVRGVGSGFGVVGLHARSLRCSPRGARPGPSCHLCGARHSPSQQPHWQAPTSFTVQTRFP